MHSISMEELIMAVRRQSQGFSRGTSSYRGVTHHPSGDPPPPPPTHTHMRHSPGGTTLAVTGSPMI